VVRGPRQGGAQAAGGNWRGAGEGRPPAGGRGKEAFVLGRLDGARDRAAEAFAAREAPEVGEIPALLRFDRLHAAVAAFEEDAGAVGLFRQHQPAPVGPQPGEVLDEVALAQTQVSGQAGDFRVREPHLPGPAAARGAPL